MRETSRDERLIRPGEKASYSLEYRYRMRLLEIRHYMEKVARLAVSLKVAAVSRQSSVPKWAYMPTAGAVAA